MIWFSWGQFKLFLFLCYHPSSCLSCLSIFPIFSLLSFHLLHLFHLSSPSSPSVSHHGWPDFRVGPRCSSRSGRHHRTSSTRSRIQWDRWLHSGVFHRWVCVISCLVYFVFRKSCVSSVCVKRKREKGCFFKWLIFIWFLRVFKDGWYFDYCQFLLSPIFWSFLISFPVLFKAVSFPYRS